MTFGVKEHVIVLDLRNLVWFLKIANGIMVY
jgi:hypothetical protein